MACQPGMRPPQVARTTRGTPAASASGMGRHSDVYASDGVILAMVGSFFALLFASSLWSVVRVVPRRGRAAIMTLCCFMIVIGVLVQGLNTEPGWRVVADAAVLLNVFMFVEIAHVIRIRRSPIALAIVRR